MKITIMGSASAAGSIERDNTYLLVQYQNSGWLIDVGGNPLGKLKQVQLSLHHIQGVILTHLHIDHIYGLPSLLWGMWLAGRTEPLIIYCPKTGESQLQSILDSYLVEQWPSRFTVELRGFDWQQPSTLFDDGSCSLSVFPALHMTPTVGVKITHKEKRFIYSSDTRPNEWIRDQSRIDVLIHEATQARGSKNNHTSLEQLIQYYPLDRIGHTFVVHLTDNEHYDAVLEQYAANIGTSLSIGKDMQVITL